MISLTLRALLLVGAALAADAPSPSVTPGRSPSPDSRLHVRYGDCAADLVFDSGRISETRLRDLVRLLPDSAGSWDYEWVSSGAGELRGMERLERELLHHDDVSARFEAELARLQPPQELAPLVEWTRARWSAASWMDRATLQFCRTRDPAPLRSGFLDIDPSRSCAKEIKFATECTGECLASVAPWRRCVNRLMPSGDHPAAAWYAFQQAHGVTGANVVCAEDF